MNFFHEPRQLPQAAAGLGNRARSGFAGIGVDVGPAIAAAGELVAERGGGAEVAANFPVLPPDQRGDSIEIAMPLGCAVGVQRRLDQPFLGGIGSLGVEGHVIGAQRGAPQFIAKFNQFF